MVLDDLTHVNDSHVGKRTLSKLDFAREFSQQQSLHISDDMMKCLGRDELIIDQDTISRGDLLLATTIFSTCPTFKKVVIVSTSSPGTVLHQKCLQYEANIGCMSFRRFENSFTSCERAYASC